ncbi:MAG: hypothetical protein JSR09_09360 [Bacteroidetes bacterium]|nr:hypothetical protein [Bacteroidota bacterium]MBS1649897.1 hypothetical protein [Bacteroidota bacterium]
MKNILNIKITIILITILLPVFLYAQIGDPSNIDPDGNAPIDGGLSLLIAGGIGYGIKRIKMKKNIEKF